MSTEENRKLALSFYDAFNRKDLGRMRELLSSDFVEHEVDPAFGLPSDREGVIAWVEAMHRAMSDVRIEAQDTLVDADRVAVRMRLTGTHDGELFGIPPSGRHVDIDGVDIVRVADGVAVEHWGVTDTQRLFEQIGVAPLPAQVRAVQAVYTAFGAGDVDGILAQMAEDVAWEPGVADHGIPWIVPGTGKAAVAAFLGSLNEHLEIIQMEPQAFTATGGHVAVVLDIEARAKATGTTFEDHEVHVWTVDETGAITSFRHVIDTRTHAAAAGV